MKAIPVWIVYALLSMFFAGLTSVAAKMGLKNVSGDVGLALRTSVVFALVWLNALAFHNMQQASQLTKKDIVFLVISGITTTLSWIFYYRAIKEGNVSVVASIDKASLIVTILLAFWFLKEPLTARMLVASGLILSGTLLLIFK